ncbi:hypothetical protein LR48_Vigan11g071600 [Vigna angularis]|uniref:Uncharacterized protein n=1 Tax=Phaseolus angularis TaxID=3914 RepID=A0A0L9VRV4_PHAAN|nr:hypothetical protein LR48_Vigan11g071600 [Vigna angularis]
MNKTAKKINTTKEQNHMNMLRIHEEQDRINAGNNFGKPQTKIFCIGNEKEALNEAIKHTNQ